MKKWYIIIALIAFIAVGAFSQETVENLYLSNQEGKQLSVTEIIEKPTNKVFLFWSKYCRLCKLEMKGIRNMGKQWFTDYDAEIYFISLENYPSKAYESVLFLNELPKKGVYRLFDNNMSFYNSLGGNSIPLTVLLDKNGTTIQKWHSYDNGLESSIGMYFKKLKKAENQEVIK